MTRLDAQRGNSLAGYEAMGEPRYPSQEQIKRRNLAAELPKSKAGILENGALRLSLPVMA